MMMSIRTPNRKMVGTLDVQTYMFHIKDGKVVRVIQVPAEGLKLLYVMGSSPPEEVYIPPKATFNVVA